MSDGVALASLGIFRFHHRKIRLYLFVATFFSYIRVSTAQDLIYYGEAINEYCSVVVLCLQNMYESCWQLLDLQNLVNKHLIKEILETGLNDCL